MLPLDAALAFVERKDFDGQPAHITPGDSGGLTSYGITAAAWQRGLDAGLVKGDLSRAKEDDARVILRELYWKPLGGELLPPAVALIAFNIAMLSGETRAAQLMQALAGVKADGHVGPITVAAIARLDPMIFAAKLTKSYLAFLQALPGYDRFGTGWSIRSLACLAYAGKFLPGS